MFLDLLRCLNERIPKNAQSLETSAWFVVVWCFYLAYLFFYIQYNSRQLRATLQRTSNPECRLVELVEVNKRPTCVFSLSPLLAIFQWQLFVWFVFHSVSQKNLLITPFHGSKSWGYHFQLVYYDIDRRNCRMLYKVKWRTTQNAHYVF